MEEFYNNNNECSVQEIQGVVLDESNTDNNMGSCDSLMEIVNYLDSEEDYNFENKLNGLVKNESEDYCVTVTNVTDKNVDLPDIPTMITKEMLFKRSSSVRSDTSDHIISQFLDRSIDDVR